MAAGRAGVCVAGTPKAREGTSMATGRTGECVAGTPSLRSAMEKHREGHYQLTGCELVAPQEKCPHFVYMRLLHRTMQTN